MQSFALDYVLLCLRLAIEERYIEGCLERIGEDNPEEEQLRCGFWENETQREVVIDCLKAECEIRRGRPPGL